MQITNHSSVHVPLETLWGALNDVERVGPYVPGFDLQEVDGDTYRGTVKVKVGAITVAYNAEIEVLERNEAERRVVMAVSGRERRGPGSMSANVISVLTGAGADTEVSMTTDLQVTGRVAQFGSGVLADVSTSLLKQFLSALEAGLTAPTASAPAAAGEAGAGGPAASQSQPRFGAAGIRPAAVSDVVDLTGAAGRSVLKRAAPPALGGLMIAAIFYVLGRRHRP